MFQYTKVHHHAEGGGGGGEGGVGGGGGGSPGRTFNQVEREEELVQECRISLYDDVGEVTLFFQIYFFCKM